MISCIFAAAFYAIGIFVNAIINSITIITNLQTNFCFMLGALYQVSFSNFQNVICLFKNLASNAKQSGQRGKN